MTYFVYILGSEILPKTYVGYCSDLVKRLDKHNNGQVPFTSKYKPWKLLYFESELTKDAALKREKYFKSSAGRRKMKSILKEVGYDKG